MFDKTQKEGRRTLRLETVTPTLKVWTERKEGREKGRRGVEDLVT